MYNIKIYGKQMAKNFTILNPWLPIWKSDKIELTHSLVIPVQERTTFFIATDLFNYMLSIFLETVSFSSVEKLLNSLWKATNENEEKFIKFKTIKMLLLSFGYSSICGLVMKNQNDLIKKQSLSLSGDHTYKFVKNLTVFSGYKQKEKVKK